MPRSSTDTCLALSKKKKFLQGDQLIIIIIIK